MPATKLPRNIAVGVRVQETKAPKRIGTVVRAVGNRKWEVKFDGVDKTEVKSSNGALKIYKLAWDRGGNFDAYKKIIHLRSCCRA